MSKTVTWLHLSDLHAWEKRNWDANRVLTTLQTDLRQMVENYDLHPDLVFFTGDAAQGQMGKAPPPPDTLAEQYREVKHFFDEVLTTFNPRVSPENLFIVPGNHDVNRSQVRRGDTNLLDSMTDIRSVIKILEDGGVEWTGYMVRLKEYREFLDANGYSHLLQHPDYLMYSAIRAVNGIDIRIVGLNSAWSCGRDNEKGKLWVGGEYQLNYLASKYPNAPISIVLSHHPTTWLTEYEGGGLSKQIEQDFRFHLHGHEHDSWVTIMADGHTRIAAAACYERSDKPTNGYNFVRFDLDSGMGEVWLRQYDSIGRGWIPRIIYKKTDNNGRWPLNNLEWLERLDVKPLEKKQPTASPVQQGFELKTTILKHLISEEKIETLKLRTLKALREVRQIVIDPQPRIEKDGIERRARVPDFYSLPGTLTKTPEGMFQVDFRDYDVLRPGKEHCVVIGYTVQERVEDAFAPPPGVIAQQPVGSESLVIEVHFPRDWHFRRDSKGEAKWTLYVKDPKTKESSMLFSVPGSIVTVDARTHNFGGGDRDYFQVRIIKPPQDADIWFDWEWEKEGSTKVS